MDCYGKKKEDKRMNLGFQVADVKKPLIAVKRITEKGNRVSFGPDVGDNYIVNDKTGDKLMLRPNGRGSYLMDVSFPGGKKAEITVDSGAEENVCPRDWGSEFPMRDVACKMRFRGASGEMIAHHGQRSVVVTADSF